MARLTNNVKNRLVKIWGAILLLGLSCMLYGWKQTFPLTMDYREEIFNTVSPFFWLGMFIAFLALLGVEVFSQSKWLQFLLACLFIILITSPQFLYLSWGSDTGVLADFVDYIQRMQRIDIREAIQISSYFQWPFSIIITGFVGDFLNIDPYTTVLVTYLIFILAIGCGMYILLNPFESMVSIEARAIFWGIAVYFIGLYWIHNWQAVPYTFSMALFIPGLAILVAMRDQGQKPRWLFLLFFITMIETHAMVSIWILAISIFMFLGFGVKSIFSKQSGKNYTTTIILLMFVIISTIILFKNFQFFNYIVLELQGYYKQLIYISTSDLALRNYATLALGNNELSVIGSVLKFLSWIQMALVLVVFGVSTIIALKKKKFRVFDTATLAVGAGYFIFGIQFATIGIRGFTLIGFAVAWFVSAAIAEESRIRNSLLYILIIVLILTPFAVSRSFQNYSSHMTPYDVSVKKFLTEINPEFLIDINLFSEHKKNFPLGGSINSQITPRIVKYRNRLDCEGMLLVVDTDRFEFELAQLSPIIVEKLLSELSTAPTIFDNGFETISIIPQCSVLNTNLLDIVP